MMRVRRHHLIEEAKAELDLAYNEVKRAETRIMELEFEFNERMKAAQADRSDRGKIQALNEEKERQQSEFDIELLYDVQNEAVQRFARISASFAIVGSIDDEKITVDLIKRLLQGRRDPRQQPVHRKEYPYFPRRSSRIHAQSQQPEQRPKGTRQLGRPRGHAG